VTSTTRPKCLKKPEIAHRPHYRAEGVHICSNILCNQKACGKARQHIALLQLFPPVLTSYAALRCASFPHASCAEYFTSADIKCCEYNFHLWHCTHHTPHATHNSTRKALCAWERCALKRSARTSGNSCVSNVIGTIWYAYFQILDACFKSSFRLILRNWLKWLYYILMIIFLRYFWVSDKLFFDGNHNHLFNAREQFQLMESAPMQVTQQ
jgi:hypothetical protein